MMPVTGAKNHLNTMEPHITTVQMQEVMLIDGVLMSAGMEIGIIALIVNVSISLGHTIVIR